MYACREKNGLPENEQHKLSDKNYTVVKTTKDDVYYRRQCMHCQEPACASVCPVGALEKTPEGPVTYDPDKCMGCRYCMVSCPYNVPKYTWGSANPVVSKCQMCYDRIAEGKLPACADVCPTGATLFGDRDELIKEAHKRINDNPDQYYPHLYGEKEAGGTSVMYLASVPFVEFGLKSEGYDKPFPDYTWQAMKEIPAVVATGGIFLYGLWWLINRRMEIEKGTLTEMSESKEEHDG